MKLILIRHPKTVAGDGVCYGRSDVEVLPELTRQVAQRVAAGLPHGSSMTSSPLLRCAGLALAIGALRPDLEHGAHDTRIAEMDFGAWEQREWKAIARSEFDAWMQDFADSRAGGTGESTRQFMQRVGHAYDDWRAAGRDAVWVTHSGVIRAVQLLNRGLRYAERSDQWPRGDIEFGAVVAIEARDPDPGDPTMERRAQGAGVFGLKLQKAATAHSQHLGLRATQT